MSRAVQTQRDNNSQWLLSAWLDNSNSCKRILLKFWAEIAHGPEKMVWS